MRQKILVALLLTFVAVEGVSVAKSTDSDIVLKVSTDKHSSRDSHHFSGEWLESPWGDLYQFRAGDQNWLTAREHCLSLNADLAAIRNVEQLDWILSHYAPLSSRFAQRLVQIGLYAPEGQNHEWKWSNGEEINKTLQWNSGEPYDHSMEGRERCGLLNVEKRLLDDVDCETTTPDHHAQRYICQRTSENHKQQQRSNNYIWQKIENLFSFFGIGGSPTAHNATVSTTNDYEDEVIKNETTTVKSAAKFSDSEEETSSEEEESVAKTLAALPKIEGSGESTILKELKEPEGSGQIVDKKAIEATDLIPGVDEKKLDKMIDKMEEMIKSIDDLTVPPAGLERTTVSTIVLKKANKEKKEVEEKKSEEKSTEEVKEKKNEELNDNKISESIEGDFDQAQSKDMPKADIEPPEEQECDEDDAGSGEEEENEESDEKIELAPEKEDKIKEFLGVLRLFLDRAEHGDLRKLLDDQSGKTLLERMKNAVREANKREFEMLEKLESSKKTGDKDELVKTLKKDQMSAEEQKDLYKKISSAVMKAAKLHKIEDKVQDEQAMEKFNIAKEKADSEESEGTLEVLKSAREGKAEKKEKVGDDDYYGDYLDDNNVIKVQNREKKDAKEEQKEEKLEKVTDKAAVQTEVKEKGEAAHDEPKKVEKKEEEKKESNDVKEAEDKESEETTTAKEEKTSEEPTTTVETTTEEVKTEEKNALKEKEEEESTTTEESRNENVQENTTEGSAAEETSTASSMKPAEAEEDEAELEASGHEDVSTTTESTTVSIKEVPVEEIEKIAKLEAKQLTEDEPVTEETKEETTTASAATTAEPKKESSLAQSTTEAVTTPKSTTPEPVTTTKLVTVSVKQVSPEEMEKLSKMEATEKVTLLPPLPTFTFPTLAPFTFPTLPTLATAKPTPAPKVPTLEEILGNLNDQFKKLLSPPKPLPSK